MLIDYSVVKAFNQTLEIDDPGNCAIIAHGTYRDGKIKFPGDYYMIIKTVMGTVKIIKWGPSQPDLLELPGGFSLEIKCFKYKEASINREITLFLNDGMKEIYEAAVITQDEAISMLPKDYNYVATLE